MASTRKTNATDSAVRERRLRPIYELLDSSNNKRVVQEVDRLLKKQPDAVCAKVLKALALLRMGKTAECEAILGPIVEEVQTDDNVIQALSICYRELDQPQMICQVLEKTSQVDKSEDVLTNCFMAYARVADYQKQHQTALSLYKMYLKTPYFSWAIMSLYGKAERDSDPLVTKVSLPLAERMMAKFIDENKLESELTDHELTLYALILRRQKKYDKMLELLDASYGKLKLSDSMGFYNKYKTECLVQLQKHDELANFMETNLRQNPDDYNSYAEYIKNFAESQTDKVIEFLKEMRDNEKCGRSPLLAYLYLFQFLFDRRIEMKVAMDPISIFKTYAEQYGNKPSFFMDLCGFLSGLQKQDAKEAFLAIMKDFIKTPIEYLNPNEIQRHINYRYMSRFFSSREQEDAVKVLNYVTSSIEIYLNGNEAYEEGKRLGKQFDEIALDEFVIMPCLALVDSFWFGATAWKGIFKRIASEKSLTNDVKQPRRNLPSIFNSPVPLVKAENDLDVTNPNSVNQNSNAKAKNKKGAEDGTDDEEGRIDPDEKLNSLIDSSTNSISKQMENLKIGQKDYSAIEEDFPLLLNLALLEHAVTRSPKSAQLRILLSKSYIRCGAVGAGADSIIALDLKHMQWESLGYLYIWKLTSSGFFQEATRIFKLAENLYSSYQRESMEFVLSAYKYGSWEKILEFMDFRDLILDSIQYALLKIERQLLEYSKRVSLRPDIDPSSSKHKFNHTAEIAQRSEISLKSLKLDKKYTESRDFSILLTYSEEKVSQDIKDRTHEADLRKFKVRGLIALLLDQFVLASVENDYSQRLADVGILLQEFIEVAQLDYSAFNITQIPVDGMWPPRIYQYKQDGHVDLLLRMFQIALETFGGNALSNAVDEIASKAGKMVDQLIQFWSASAHNLLNRATRLERLYEFMETLGFCIILLDACMSWVKKSSSNQAKKKKKGKEVTQDPNREANNKQYNKVIEAFLDCLKRVEDVTISHPFSCPDNFPVEWDNLSDFWGKVVSHDLKTYILPYSLPTVMRKLRLSYERSLSDLKASITWKKLHLQGLRIPS